MDNNKKYLSVSGKLGFMELLVLLLIALKLTGFIDWSWWVILAPLLAWTMVVGVLVVIGAVLVVFVETSYLDGAYSFVSRHWRGMLLGCLGILFVIILVALVAVIL